jgi:multidrug resistance efflux pump
MAVSIARASLRHEARRYVAAVMSVTFADLLMLVQVALPQSGCGSRPQLHEAHLQQAQADTELRRAQAQRLQSAAQLSRTLGLGA